MHVLDISRKSKNSLPRNFLICNIKFYKNNSHHVKTTTSCLYIEQELYSDEMFYKACVPLGDISPIIIYYCNFPLFYIFVKSQVINRTKKADFDLQPMQIRCHRWYWRSVNQNIRVVNNNPQNPQFYKSCTPYSLFVRAKIISPKKKKFWYQVRITSNEPEWKRTKSFLE